MGHLHVRPKNIKYNHNQTFCLIVNCFNISRKVYHILLITVTSSTALFVAAKAGATAGQCLMDTFMVTSPGNPTPPVICGVNSGEHSNVHDWLKFWSHENSFIFLEFWYNINWYSRILNLLQCMLMPSNNVTN